MNAASSRRQAERAGDVAERRHLVDDPEVRAPNPERGATIAAGAHVAAREHGYLDARLLQELDAVAVAHAEALRPQPLARPIELAVGEHAVDVEAEQAHGAWRQASRVLSREGGSQVHNVSGRGGRNCHAGAVGATVTRGGGRNCHGARRAQSSAHRSGSSRPSLARTLQLFEPEAINVQADTHRDLRAAVRGRYGLGAGLGDERLRRRARRRYAAAGDR